MLVSDIDEPVVAAAAHTPFEASRRVFVIESAAAMNDQAANRLLKTLEEPPSFVHLLLLTDRREDLLATVSSRCQPVRFDPLPPERIAERLTGEDGESAQACARLALGDPGRAARLASEEGRSLRAGAESFARAALAGATDERPWTMLLNAARAAGAQASEGTQKHVESELELVARKDRKRFQREGLEAGRRAERRARTATLDLALGLVELWLRDLLCVREGAPELIHAVDRRAQLERDAPACDRARLLEGLGLVTDTRLRLTLNVSEELALEALAYRLRPSG
jgi:DNA polymerase-3 subunit delta'